MVAMDLRGDLSDAELAELRWQLGIGPRPAHIVEQTIVVNEVLDLLSDNQKPVQDENGDWVIKELPEPAWPDGSPYAATKIGGVDFSMLVHKQDSDDERWALTAGPSGGFRAQTDSDPDLVVDVEALAAAYLGGTSLATLQAAGRVTEVSPGAVTLAATAFRWPVSPWCPDEF